MISQERLRELAASKEGQNKKFFNRLKAKTPKDLDVNVHNLHAEAFSEIDCLDCAYCCKHLGPRILEKDIERFLKYLKIKKDEFIKDYIRVDEDGDYVFQSMPCPFLLADNYCSVYEARPKACREYPHTDRRKFHQILPLTIKNTFICPAVYEIVENLKKNYS